MDGMYARNYSLKIVVFLALLLMPFFLSGISFSKPISMNNSNYMENSESSNNYIFIAGSYQYFEAKFTNEVKKICIIFFQGNSIYETEDRSPSNFYKWEYNNGVWRDASGHDAEYIVPSKCKKENNTYYFYIGLDNKAKPGHWNIKILINDDEILSNNYCISVIAQFNLLLSSFATFYQPDLKDKKSIFDIDFICSDKKKIKLLLKENIDDVVDKVINKLSTDNKEENVVEIGNLIPLNDKLYYKDEFEKSIVFNYQRSRLKNEPKSTSFLSFKKNIWGENSFWLAKFNGYSKFIVIILATILLFTIFSPVISPDETNPLNDINNFRGLIITLMSNNKLFFKNETILFNGTVSYNNSLIDLPVYFQILSLNYSYSEVLQTINGEFSYEFVPLNTGNYCASVSVAFENFSAKTCLDFDVIEIIDSKSFIDNSKKNISMSPFDIFENPSNSLGPKLTKIVNTSYFWNFFNNYNNWYLEAWDSENGLWINETQYLKINKTRSENNLFEKIALEFTAPITSDYRLTFIIDKPLKSYVNKSNQFIYELIYSVGENEEYLTFFDFNDIASIPKIIINHGVKNINDNDIFWFSAQKNDIKVGTYVVLDPTFGNTATSTTTTSIENYIKGGYFQMGSYTGYGTNITAYLYTNGGAKNAKCALYDSSNNLVGNSITEQISYSTGWNTFNFSGTKPFLMANAWYYIVVWSYDGPGQGYLYYATSGGRGVFSDSETYVAGSYNGFPSPFERSTVDVDGLASIYCSYTYAPNAPNQTGENPANGSTNIVPIPTLNVTVDDINDDILTAYWYSNSSGSWLAFATNTSINTAGGAVNIIQKNTNFSNYGTKYWWSVNLTDGIYWNNITYNFIISYAPILSNTYPINGSTGIVKKPICNVTVYDQDSGTVIVRFYENTSGSWILQQTNNSVDVTNPANVVWNNYSNATENFKKYWWKVNVSDSKGCFVEEIYYFITGFIPVINSYNLFNSSGSKLNDATGLLDVNSEYYFSINVTDSDGWDDIAYINITSWYDNGDDSSVYNQTLGGNLNMFLQYENISGTANFNMLWPDDEVQIVFANCSERIINSTTRIINISFKPLSQIRWANSNESWNTTQNVFNDPYSWNFNITVTDETNRSDWKIDEYGVYKFTYISPSKDWVDVYALPGFSDTSNVVSITYSSNYNFNMTIYFEENLNNQTWIRTIPIANNVDILADADLNDDITSDMTFLGIGETYSIDIFNVSGIFNNNSVSQTVNVQFRIYIPIGTLGVKYTAHVATKIIHD